MRRWARIVAGALVALLSGVSPAQRMAVMAPLMIGDPHDLKSPASAEAWERFRQDLRRAKSRGFDSVSVDVWWGLVEERGAGKFDWSYYDRMAAVLGEEGLDWIAILSTHACGGNVGDDCNIPLPKWVWEKADGLHYVSEGGGQNQDVVSHFADDVVMPDYQRFWGAFRKRFLAAPPSAGKSRVVELGLSLGPSGELHYPAYHAHDAGKAESGYPHRGLFQGLGSRANEEFRASLKERYGSIESVNKAWRRNFPDFSGVSLENEIQNLSARLGTREYSAQGPLQDVLVWYHASMLGHLERMVKASSESLGTEVPFAVKIPGVHWDPSRGAELMNGLLDPRDGAATWDSVEAGLGYADLFDRLKKLERELPGIHLHAYLTAAATPDATQPEFSRGETLVKSFARLSEKSGISLGVENALSGDIYSDRALQILEAHLGPGRADRVTLLRIGDVLQSPLMTPERCHRLLGKLLKP